jgi:hypothetical protein
MRKDDLVGKIAMISEKGSIRKQCYFIEDDIGVTLSSGRVTPAQVIRWMNSDMDIRIFGEEEMGNE